MLTRTGTIRLAMSCFIAAGLAISLHLSPAAAQSQHANQGNWKLANKFTTDFLRQYVYTAAVTPTFLKDSEKFWYSWRDRNGVKYWIVDPGAKSKKPIFDHVKMAGLLSEMTKKPQDAANLALSQLTFSDDGKKITFTADAKRYEFDLSAETLKIAPPPPRPTTPGTPGAAAGQQDQQQDQQQQQQDNQQQNVQQRGGGQGFGGGRFGGGADFRNYSPDRKSYVYAKDHNLYYVDTSDEAKPVQLTTDGEKNYSFGSRADRDELQRQFQNQFQQQQQQQNQQQQQQRTTTTGGAFDAAIDEQSIDPVAFEAFVDWAREAGFADAAIAELQQGQRGGRGGGGGFGGQGFGGGQGRFNPNEDRVRANVTWSPDSKCFYVTRGDNRKVAELFLVNNIADPRPSLLTYRYSMPGEANVSQTELFVFQKAGLKFAKLDIGKWKDQRLMNIEWPGNSDYVRFIRRDRLQRNLEVCEMNLSTKALAVLINESVENAYLETQAPRILKASSDVIWWSERSGWGHFYLYDKTGKLKHAITSGAWRAESVKAVDEEKGLLYFEGYGREANENPYYRHLYRVGLDGKGLTLLDEGNADHATTLSTKRGFIVDTYSRVDAVPKAVLRDDKGKVILELEEMDVSRLKETGWKMPETFTVKAADGVTDIYGDMWKPFDFDPKKEYPIIANVYPGPQTESVTDGFTATPVAQRLAQLGFIVIQIGNRGGNPHRSNAYHSYGYYNLRDYGLADKKAGIEQLASRFPWIDIDRVGIFGHSGGGFMTAAAMMLPPFNDFFKVGVSSSGNHDNNIYNQNWSEQHHGLKEVKANASTTGATTGGTTGTRGGVGGGSTGGTTGADDTAQGGQTSGQSTQGTQSTQSTTTTGTTTDEMKFEIKVPTTTELAPNLKGRLLLVTGDMDNNVHPANTIRLVNALIKANKRFDFMIMPGQAHGYGTMQPYFTQLMFEYFAEHLLGDYYRGNAEIRGGG